MKNIFKQKGFKWLVLKYKPIYFYVLAVCILTAINSVLGVQFAFLTKNLIDIASKKTNGNFLSATISLLILLIIQLIFMLIINYLSAKGTCKLEISLKKTFFEKLLKKQWLKISSYHSGDILSRANNDSNIVINSAMNFLPTIVGLITSLIASFYGLFIIDSVFAFVILSIGPVFLISGYFYGKLIKKIHKMCQESSTHVLKFIQEAVQNIVVIKTFQNENKTSNKFEALQNENYNMQMKKNRYGLVSSGGMYIVFWIGYLFAVIWGAYRFRNGLITFGGLTVFFQLSNQVQAPFMSISKIITGLFGAIASVERIMEIENLDEEQQLKEENITNISEIRFENITYKYDKENVLNNVSFSINKGDFAVIAGESGVGKTTIFRILLGLIDKQNGNTNIIFENDKSVEISVATRKYFSYVPQGNIIFSGTIRENLCFTDCNISDEEIEKATKCACIFDFINELPMKFDTIIGERGVGLSEGQGQRIAIARAILNKSPILLLDEATSALDNATEIQILNNIKKLDYLTACVIVSHRENAFKIFDKIINVTN